MGENTDQGRTCLTCDEFKPWDDFHKASAGAGQPRGRKPRCKLCVNFARTPEPTRRRPVAGRTQRDIYLWNKYGITEVQYDAMVAEQGGLCALCGLPGELVVDHDHATGAIRGLLHGLCNVGIGALGDDLAALRKAITYLENYECSH